MLMRSISSGSAPATAHATACFRIRSYSRSRSWAGTSFESQTPAMCRSGCSTTAAATTGPARQPRPTSSAPATYTNPTRRSAFSRVRIAGTRTTGMPRPLGLHVVLHARRLALEIAQVVQLRAADARRFRDLDLLDRRRVQRENALDALTERHLADRERRPGAAAVDADDDAFEHLDAFLVALTHLDVHFDGISGTHGRPIGQLRLLDEFDRSHLHPPAPRSTGWRVSSRNIASSSSSSAAPASRSGRRSSVRLTASRLRQRRISAWLPERSTGGTASTRSAPSRSRPPQTSSAGRVYCGKSSSPRLN